MSLVKKKGRSREYERHAARENFPMLHEVCPLWMMLYLEFNT